jgi:hypothetical protein
MLKHIEKRAVMLENFPWFRESGKIIIKANWTVE